MFPSPLRRLAALAAVVALGFIAPVPAAQAHPGHHRQSIDTHLAITKERLGHDGIGEIGGRLTARNVPLAERRVFLLIQREDRSWVRVRDQRTNRRGAVSFRVSPELPSTYQLVFLGGGRFEQSRSRLVRLAPRTTAVAATVEPGMVDPGGAATISAVVTNSDVPVAAGAIELLARTRKTDPWAVAATGTTAEDGTVSFTVTPERTTRYVVRLVRSEEHQGARSDVLVVKVKAPTHLSIRKDTFGQVFAVAGVLRSQGATLAGRNVTLQQLDPGASEWVDAATKKTKRDGWVGFRRDLVAGTSFRLTFAGTPRLAAATSRTVVAGGATTPGNA